MKNIINNIYYVYVYLDPRKVGKYNYGSYSFDHEPFYVGKGKNERHIDHLKNHILENDNNKLKTNKIKKIIRETNSNPIIIKYKEKLIEEDAVNLEKDMIAIIGRIDLKTGCLVNLTDGGDGVINLNTNTLKEKGKKHSIYMKGRYVGKDNGMFGKKYNEQEKQLFVERANKKYKDNPSIREKISKTVRDKFKNNEFKLKHKNSYSEEVKNKMSNSIKEWHINNNHPLLGKTRNKNTKLKIKNKLEKFIYIFENIETKEVYNSSSLKDLCLLLGFSKTSYVVLISYFSKNKNKYKNWKIKRIIKGED